MATTQVRASRSTHARWFCHDCRKADQNTRNVRRLMLDARAHADHTNHRTVYVVETRVDFERRSASSAPEKESADE